MNKKAVILGAGNFAEETLDIIKESSNLDIVAFVEGVNREACSGHICGIPIIWIDDLANVDSSMVLISGIGSPKRKNVIEHPSLKKFSYTNVVHPSARISTTTQLGSDILVNVGCIISSSCTINDHVLINRAVVIGNNVTISKYVTLSPGVNIGGNTIIGESTFIGMGAIILDHITIGSNSIVGAGAVVTKNIPDNVLVMGIPARIIKEIN